MVVNLKRIASIKALKVASLYRMQGMGKAEALTWGWKVVRFPHCPRCSGNIIGESGDLYCLQCGWRLSSDTPEPMVPALPAECASALRVL